MPGAPPEDIDLELAADLVCEASGTSLAELRGRSTAVRISQARKALATLVVDRLGHSVADVADLLQKHPGSVSRWLETPRRADRHDNSGSAILETATKLGCDLTKM